MTNSVENGELPPEFTRQDMLDQLGRAADLCSSEDQVLWSIFGAFWGANTVLLVALFATGTLPTNHYVGVAISTVGTFLSFTWHIIQQRAIGHLKRFETLMERLERSLSIPSQFAVSGKINVDDYIACVGNTKFRARTLMRACSSIAVFLWFLGLVYFMSLQAWAK